MPPRCFLGCPSDLDSHLHVFPNPDRFPEQFRKWVAIVGGQLNSPADYTFYRMKRLCDKHFTEKDRNRNNRLNALAVPSLFLRETEGFMIAIQDQIINTKNYRKYIIKDPTVANDKCYEQMHGFETQTASSVERPSTSAIPSIPLNKAPTEENNNRAYWKQKVNHILHSTQFCGICLSTDELVDTVNDHFEIVVGGTSHSRTLADIIDAVFQETEDLLSNSQICSSCTQKLIQSYMFIQQARARSKMLKYHLTELYLKTCYIRNNVMEDLSQKHDDVSNVIISMENCDNLDQFQNNLYTKSQKKKVKRDRRRLKQRYKCLTCNLFLPSHKAWRVHEITNHRINMNKTQLNSRKHHGRILKRMCRICYKVIKNGELFKHLKKFHRDSLCPVCYVAFNSLEDLEAHKQTWHYSDVGKCLTCLKSYSEAEQQQHQCWFSCNVCTEAPCVHHKYLTCYRQQILNGALRAKCLDCQFVCRTKRAYLEHVNMCHLKFSAESSVKC